MKGDRKDTIVVCSLIPICIHILSATFNNKNTKAHPPLTYLLEKSVSPFIRLTNGKEDPPQEP